MGTTVLEPIAPDGTPSTVALLRMDPEKCQMTPHRGGDEEAAAAAATNAQQRHTAAYIIAMATIALLAVSSIVLLAVGPDTVTGRSSLPRQPAPCPLLEKPREKVIFEEVIKIEHRNSPQIVNKPEKGESNPKGPSPPGLLVMDVDAGADDALALLLVLRQEELARAAGEEPPRLMAVTCTHGNTELRNVQRNVLKTLHLAGRLDIPVFSGAYGSLIITPPGDNFFGIDGFGDFEYENAPDPAEYLQKEHAVSALVRMAKENPGQITLLATGPLSNLALATRLDPDFLNNLQQLVIMGGSTDGSGNMNSGVEFNFFLDPEANYIVFNSTTNASKPIYLVPWDTTARRNLIDLNWRLDVLGTVQSKYVDFLNKAERLQLESEKESGTWVSADPITAAMLIRPDLITNSEKHHVDAETHGEYSRGAILVDYYDRDTPKNTLIVKDFDVENYKNLLLRNLS